MTHYLDLERKVADSINDKYGKANDARDWPTSGFLKKFVDYQVEEEEEADALAEEMYRLTKKGDLSQLLDIEQRKK
jgi:ferritin